MYNLSWVQMNDWLWKHISVIDRHDMTFAVKVVLNPDTTIQQQNE